MQSEGEVAFGGFAVAAETGERRLFAALLPFVEGEHEVAGEGFDEGSVFEIIEPVIDEGGGGRGTGRLVREGSQGKAEDEPGGHVTRRAVSGPGETSAADEAAVEQHLVRPDEGERFFWWADGVEGVGQGGHTGEDDVLGFGEFFLWFEDDGAVALAHAADPDEQARPCPGLSLGDGSGECVTGFAQGDFGVRRRQVEVLVAHARDSHRIVRTV